MYAMANTMDRSDAGKLQEILLQADTDNCRTLTLHEFISSVRKISPEVDEAQTKDLLYGLITKNLLSKTFERIDKDGRGKSRRRI